ncbi:MAG: hypothetical protein QXF48_02000 [Candidatus Anstonellaceae archaeon]
MNWHNKNFFLFLVYFLCCFKFFFGITVYDKQQATFEFLNSYNISSDRLDHFVGYDGREYVLVYSYAEPFALLVLNIDNNSIKVDALVDNQTIENVLYKRSAFSPTAVENTADFIAKLLPLIDNYLEDVKFKELKYSFLLGLNNSYCTSASECREICFSSLFCHEAYKYKSSEIIDGMLEFSEIKKAFSSLIESEKMFRQKLNNYTDQEILDYYLNFFEKLNHYSTAYSSLKIQSKDSIIYAGDLSFSSEVLADSYSKLKEYYENFIKNKKFREGIEKIKQNSELFKKTQSNTSVIYSSEENPVFVFKSLEENNSEINNKTIQNEVLENDSKPALSQKIEKNTNLFSQIDMLLTIVAAAIVFYALFKFVFIFLCKKASCFNAKNSKKEQSFLSKLFSKKQKTLEDL